MSDQLLARLDRIEDKLDLLLGEVKRSRRRVLQPGRYTKPEHYAGTETPGPATAAGKTPTAGSG